jgi:hypothetical protein
MIRSIRPALALLVIIFSSAVFAAEHGQTGSPPELDEPAALATEDGTNSESSALRVIEGTSDSAEAVAVDNSRGAYRASRDGEGDRK